jgi:hypothetical protein
LSRIQMLIYGVMDISTILKGRRRIYKKKCF